MIFGSFEGSISKSVAQFFAPIFAYIMMPIKSVNDIIFRIFEVFRVHLRWLHERRKSSENPHKLGISLDFEPPKSI